MHKLWIVYDTLLWKEDIEHFGVSLNIVIASNWLFWLANGLTSVYYQIISTQTSYAAERVCHFLLSASKLC